jgi:hypothetical protein
VVRPDEPSGRATSARFLGIVAVVVLPLLLVSALALRGDGTSSAPGSGTQSSGMNTTDARAVADPEAVRAAAAAAALFRQQQAVTTQDERAFAATFASTPRARDLAEEIFANLTRMPLSSYSLRYVGEVSGGARWTADVQARWALAGYDQRPVAVELRATFVRRGEVAKLVDLSAPGAGRTPEWLLGQLDVRRVGAALLLSAQPERSDEIASLTRRAVRDVRRVLGRWPGTVVVVLPRTTKGLEQLLGASAGSHDSIAAVTSAADGTSDATTPVRVLLNPRVFTALGRTGARVVLAHEATHAATGAGTSDLPLWLVEGFADYVALARAPVPVEVAAGQALSRVRREGPPAGLPSDGDFSTAAHRLGVSYESAWLACRLIAQQNGEDALVRFYRRAQRAGGVGAAFEAVLGTDERTFVRRWRRHLQGLA